MAAGTGSRLYPEPPDPGPVIEISYLCGNCGHYLGEHVGSNGACVRCLCDEARDVEKAVVEYPSGLVIVAPAEVVDEAFPHG